VNQLGDLPVALQQGLHQVTGNESAGSGYECFGSHDVIEPVTAMTRTRLKPLFRSPAGQRRIGIFSGRNYFAM
jgi:hypothetical protein